jgi:hypothetical protein
MACDDILARRDNRRASFDKTAANEKYTGAAATFSAVAHETRATLDKPVRGQERWRDRRRTTGLALAKAASPSIASYSFSFL